MNEKRRRANALMAKYYSGMIDEGGWRHASGDIAVFNTKYRRNLKSLIVRLEPVQAGSGAPSPDNVRPISGRTGASVYLEHSYDAQATPVKTISWEIEAGTVYGGTVDLVSGVLTVDCVMFARNTAAMNNLEAYPGWKNSGIHDLGYTGQGVMQNQMLNVGTEFAYNTSGAGDVIYLRPKIYGLNQSEWIAAAMDIQIIIPLITVMVYPLTPQQIQTLIGKNVIWSDAGPVSVEYWS